MNEKEIVKLLEQDIREVLQKYYVKHGIKGIIGEFTVKREKVVHETIFMTKNFMPELDAEGEIVSKYEDPVIIDDDIISGQHNEEKIEEARKFANEIAEKVHPGDKIVNSLHIEEENPVKEDMQDDDPDEELGESKKKPKAKLADLMKPKKRKINYDEDEES